MFSWLFALVLNLYSVEFPALVSGRLEPPRPEQVLVIPEPLRQLVRQRMRGRGFQQEVALRQLVEFLFDPSGLAIRYQDDATYTVEQAWQTRAANCLTFTLLTVALAREAGLEAYGQELADTLIWRQQERTLYRASHVNAGIRIMQRRFTVDVASDRVLARHAPRKVRDQRLLAQFYNNRSVELMAAGELQAALAHSRIALELDPGYATSWNNAGVVHLRLGQSAAAQRHYQRALELDTEHASALTNLAALYSRAGTPELALPLRQRLKAAQERNPFHHFLQALQLEQQADYRAAADHFRRAIRLYDGEHRFHFGLARTYYRLGRPARAARELQRALELAEGATRSLYEAKLHSLKRSG